ncbi:MAG: ribonuclease III domain-containing protein [Cyanobacteria bacterium J06641_5]
MQFGEADGIFNCEIGAVGNSDRTQGERSAAKPQVQKLTWQLEVRDLPAVSQLSPSLLAYIGDAVYELYVRTQLLTPPRRISDYHAAVVERVRAESQAAYLQQLQARLTETERDIVRRGRNAASRAPRRLSPAIYQQATGLEALIGYLFLNDPARLSVLLAEFPHAPATDERQ